MKVNERDIDQIIITKDGEVVAVISDHEIIQKDGYKVIVEPTF